MIYVVPGAEHLYQMKAVLYDTPYKNPVQEVAYEGFRSHRGAGSLGQHHGACRAAGGAVRHDPLLLENATGWRSRLAALPELTTDIAFRFLVFEKE